VLFADNTTTSTTSSSSLWTFLPLLVLGAALYFLFLRPQSKRRREVMQMQSNMAPGDEVQTVGGLYGTVTEVNDESVTIEAAPGVHLRFARQAIGKVVTKADQPEDDAGNEDAENVVDRT
jgi:preprotein translocase subunit YajC